MTIIVNDYILVYTAGFSPDTRNVERIEVSSKGWKHDKAGPELYKLRVDGCWEMISERKGHVDNLVTASVKGYTYQLCFLANIKLSLSSLPSCVE